MSVPLLAGDNDIASFLQSNRDWLNRQVARITGKEFNHQTPHQHLPLWGEQYPIVEVQNQNKAELQFTRQQGFICVNLTPAQRTKKLEQFYRQELTDAMDQWHRIWPQKLQVSPAFTGIRKMHTKWGSCNVTKKRIWLSLELAKYPVKCAEMVFVHELVHLLETHHTVKFYQLMTDHMPDWKTWDQVLQKQ